ncbi:hypothetical protein [Streptomyces sp. NBC_01221]|uniref:hypothetical protein n=1 Tax=unclassified Streptomyces TaxID=2593676 RepID=UPI002B1D4A90|nr:hypothetical protein [Streptomyces sp. NBC_01221]
MHDPPPGPGENRAAEPSSEPRPEPARSCSARLGSAPATAALHAQGLIDRRPALIAVQAEAVSPLAAAFRADANDLPAAPGGAPAPTVALAEGITTPPPTVHPPAARRAPPLGARVHTFVR